MEGDKTKIRVGPWHYGIDARPGFLLDPATLLYARVGIEWARIKLEEIADYRAFGGGSLQFDLPIYASRSKPASHLRLGLGFEKYIGSHVSFRGDYVYTDYGSVSVSENVTGYNTGGAATQGVESVNVHLRNHSLLFGLAYHFCPVGCEGFEYNYNCPSFTGVYVAGTVGGALLNGDVHGHVLANLADTGAMDLGLSPNLERVNFDATLYLGFGFEKGCLYAGVEGFAQYARPQSSQFDGTRPNPETGGGDIQTINTTNKFSLRPWHGGVALRPGFLVSSNTLLYGTIGTSIGVIEGKSNVTAIGNGAGSDAGKLSFSSSSVRASLRVGAGIEYAWNPCWHIRLDYAYDNYGSLHMHTTQTTATAAGPAVLSEDIRAQFTTHSANIGIARYF